MARKLKTYQTSLGFFDLAIAAPSMKAALEAWGADSNLFHQGAAKESADPDVIAAAMKKPGVVLRRPVGSEGSFASMPNYPPIWAAIKDRRKHPAGRKAKKRRSLLPSRATRQLTETPLSLSKKSRSGASGNGRARSLLVRGSVNDAKEPSTRRKQRWKGDKEKEHLEAALRHARG